MPKWKDGSTVKLIIFRVQDFVSAFVPGQRCVEFSNDLGIIFGHACPNPVLNVLLSVQLAYICLGDNARRFENETPHPARVTDGTFKSETRRENCPPLVRQVGLAQTVLGTVRGLAHCYLWGRKEFVHFL